MRRSWLAPALALAALPALAQAPGPDALNVRSLAAMCANCHGTDGRAMAGTVVPGLAGVPRAELAAALREFKAGTRPATIMHQIAKGYSEAQIDQLAAWFAAQPK